MGSFNFQLTDTQTPGQLDLIVTSSTTLTWTNAGTSPSNPGVWDIGTTQNWASSVPAATAYAENDNVQFTDTNVLGPATLSSPQNITISGTVHPGLVEFQNNSVAYSVGGGIIAGATQLDLDATGTVTTGTVTLSGANTYSGGTFVTNGSLRVGASSSGGSNASVTSGPVGTGAVTIGATGGSNNTSMYLSGASGGLSLGNSIVIASGGSGTVTIGGQNTSGIDTFSGSITLGNGSSGQSLAISEPSGGELDLTGGILAGPTAAGITVNGGLVKFTAPGTYAGTTTVSAGTLRVTNTTGSATGTGPVNVSSGAVIGGGASGTPGIISGLVTINGGHLAPDGFISPASSGTPNTLTLNGGLNLGNNSSLDYILGTSSDVVTLGGTGKTLTLGTGIALNITQAAGFAQGVTYDLINYGTNTVSNPTSNFSGWTDPNAGTYQHVAFSDTGSQIDLTLTQITATAAWNFAGSGNWSDITKWSPLGTYPNGAGQTATFGSLVSSPASITVTNDINPTLGTMTFDNTAVSYTLSGGTVTMNNNNTGAAVNVNSGSHIISSDLALTDTSGTTFTVAGSSSLGVSGGINNQGNLVTFTGARRHHGQHHWNQRLWRPYQSWRRHVDPLGEQRLTPGPAGERRHVANHRQLDLQQRHGQRRRRNRQ